MNKTELLDYNIFVTRWDEKDIEKIVQNDNEQRDLFLGIIQKTK